MWRSRSLASLVVCLVLVAWGEATGAEGDVSRAPESRVRWWQDQKIGLFVHWGPWAMSGRGMIWDLARAPDESGRRELQARYAEFRPDGTSWPVLARLARESGMRYVVFTAKHHDGFANFDTHESGYRITAQNGAQPGSADLVAAYVAAVRNEGLGVGLYYSHRDWHHPDGVWDRAHWAYERVLARRDPERWASFVEFETAQVRELLGDYGPIDVLWFDGDWRRSGREHDAVPMLRMVRKLQPAMLMNDRGTLGTGDFRSLEDPLPAGPIPGPWEFATPVSDGEGFWYKGPGATYKSAAQLVGLLASTAGRGGNLLLGVGPAADGSLAAQEMAALQGLGAWLRVNGEAIYGTQAGPFQQAPAWGSVTRKGDRLYLIVTQEPADGGRLYLPVSNRVRSARLLAGEGLVAARPGPEGTGVEILLPPGAGFVGARVVEVDLAGPPEVVAARR